jgi:DNA-binding PadR family transcriptional regulator
MLYGYSEAIVPRPPDWDENTVVTGYWFLDSPAGWQPPAGLVEYLAEGPPPVYVGFGSMFMEGGPQKTALVLEALAAGRHHGFDIMDATDLPSGTVYPILRRIEEEGLVKARWERDGAARREQRPPRRYYELTAAGHDRLAEARTRFRAMAALGAQMARRLKPA